MEVDPVEAERPLELVGGRGAAPAVVRIEAQERPHRDPHRQVARPVVDVHDRAGLQRRHRGVRLGRHRRVDAAIRSR